jgi:hypothetical protein
MLSMRTIIGIYVSEFILAAAIIAITILYATNWA